MMLSSILLIGAGGHARACIDVIEQEARFSVGGLIGLPDEVGMSILGYEVVGSDADLGQLSQRFGYAVVTLGQIKSPASRMRLFALAASADLGLPTIVSPRAYVSRHAHVGEGTIVMHGAVVNAGAVVGRNCIINSLALIEHDVVVGDHCHVATGASVNSGVRVGNGTFIGSGAAIRQGLSIGERTVVGMGQRLLADCPADTWLPTRKLT